MKIRGLIFDLYGTLINIETDEYMEEIYRAISHFLNYEGVFLHRWELRDLYYDIMKWQKSFSDEKYPEINVENIWDELMHRHGIRSVPRRRQLSRTLLKMYRGISRKRLELYPGVAEVLERFRASYPMGLISDAQRGFAVPEIQAVGLAGYFAPVIISSDYGFRKPDPRLFLTAMNFLKLGPDEVVFVGNDMYRDIYGASRLGIRTVFFRSNQGAQSYEDKEADYVVDRFENVPAAIDFLSQ